MSSRVLGIIVCLQIGLICATQWRPYPPQYVEREWPQQIALREYPPYPYPEVYDDAYRQVLPSSQLKSQHGSPSLKDLAKECLARDLTHGPVNFQVPGVCKQFTCANEMSGNVKKARVHSQHCVQHFVSPPCYTSEEDNTLMFPQCCPQVMCPSK